MEYSTRNIVAAILIVTIAADLTTVVSSWQNEWRPNNEILSEKEIMDVVTTEADKFKVLLVEDDKAFIGGKNRMYYVSLSEGKPLTDIEWNADPQAVDRCLMKGKSPSDCENYIRVVVRQSENRLFICGTHAFNPACRHYELKENGEFVMVKTVERGNGVCPFDPDHNSTALYTDGKLYSGTVTDFDGRYPLILQKYDNKMVRTQPRDSIFLNEPNFVSSYDKGDKVLFFFRETAVENINCGKAVFSRVGRVCKDDPGHLDTFTNFFKARLNCSIPGEFPFYFDELQATSHFGQGNYRPTKYSGDKNDMIYAIFNTPINSIKGSAVCAFRYSDIADVFRGRVKGQESFRHNWLPVSWDETPKPHPEQCAANKTSITIEHLNFIKKYSLMDEAVPARGGMPVLAFTSFSSQFSSIAIDYNFLAADKRYYDVMFVGTDDGRVIKAINKGEGSQVESVVIEDMQVMANDDPVIGLEVHNEPGQLSKQKLVVVSKRRVVTIPIHRCGQFKSCSSCVALQDPYCAWDAKLDQCAFTENGIQNIMTGKHDKCKAEPPETKLVPRPSEEGSKCTCPPVISPFPDGGLKSVPAGTSEDKDEGVTQKPILPPTDKSNIDEGQTAASKTVQAGGTAIEIVIVAVIVSVILSLVLGFFIGFKFQSCRNARDRDNVFYDTNCSSLQRGRNRLSSGDNPYFHSLAPKQMNYVVNMKNGKANTEPKPVTKSNKVYL